MVFIDADKTNYDGYYERALKLLRSGGLIALDNMLWGGKVATAEDQSPDTVALRALNAKIHEDDRGGHRAGHGGRRHHAGPEEIE